MNAIEVRQLSHRYGDAPALREVNLAVPRGCIYGYLGLNGAGKSTTIRILTTLLEPTGGQARIMGLDPVINPVAVRSIIGLVCDDVDALQRGWSARELLDYFGRARGFRHRRAGIEQLFELVGIPADLRNRPIGSLSTGMKRRVELARAMQGRPQVLFLDEPTRGLDIPARHDMWKLFKRLADEYGVTVFLSSHDAQEIQALCQQLSVIRQGTLVYTGSPERLGKDPGLFERNLLRLLEGEVQPHHGGHLGANP